MKLLNPIMILIFFVNFLYSKHNELIESMLITKNRMEIRINGDLEEKYFRQMFFVEYFDDEINLKLLHPSISLIPFVASVIAVVWASNKDFYIDNLDKDFAQSLEKIKKIMKRLYPSLSWDGNLIPRELVTNHIQANYPDYAGVMFSGGVDTTCTSLRNNHLKQLLITIWGSDVNPYDETMWHGVKKQSCAFAKNFNHDFTYLRSNFSGLFGPALYSLTPEITRWWKYTSMGLSYCGLVAPILFTRGINKLLIGSTYTPEFSCPYGSIPEIDEQICYAGIDVVHDSYDLNRQEKIELIARESKLQNKPIYLRPCWKGDPSGKNCEQCLGKCLQTMNALLIEGLNPRDFGFTLSDQEIINRTQKILLNPNKIKLSRGAIDRWKTMQKCIKKNFYNTTLYALYPQKLQDHLEWLSTIEISDYV